MTFLKVRFFFWRLLQHDFFTNGRAFKWGVSDGLSARCGNTFEHTEHLFFSCKHSWARWKDLLQLTCRSKFFNLGSSTLHTMIKEALLWHNCNPGPVIMLMEMCTELWNKRNSLTYSNQRTQWPAWVTLRNMEKHLHSLLVCCNSAKKSHRLRWSLQDCSNILTPWASITTPYAYDSMTQTPDAHDSMTQTAD